MINLKTYLILLTAILCFGFAEAQPGWTVNPSSYEFSMTVTAVLNMDGNISKDGNDRVGAFIGGVCRGTTNPSSYATAEGYKIVFLQVYSNTVLGETVTFKLYDADKGTLVDAANSLTFKNDENTGTMAAPFIITSNQNPTDIMLSSDKIMEGEDVGTEIGIFSVADPDGGAGSVNTYTLIPGAADNSNFSISGDTLKSAIVFDNDQQNTYSILTMVNDGKGGTFQKEISIYVTIDPDRFSSNNYISPNGDGKNDVWEIKNKDVYKEYKVTIYNDAGVAVFATKGYNNDWSGNLSGRKLPTGVYYFIVQSPDSSRKFTGSISLNR